MTLSNSNEIPKLRKYHHLTSHANLPATFLVSKLDSPSSPISTSQTTKTTRYRHRRLENLQPHTTCPTYRYAYARSFEISSIPSRQSDYPRTERQITPSSWSPTRSLHSCASTTCHPLNWRLWTTTSTKPFATAGFENRRVLLVYLSFSSPRRMANYDFTLTTEALTPLQ